MQYQNRLNALDREAFGTRQEIESILADPNASDFLKQLLRDGLALDCEGRAADDAETAARLLGEVANQLWIAAD
jgi:hypothetical protein